MNQNNSIKRSRINEQVIGILLKRIIKGDIPPGDKLPTERSMAAEFGVNRATVREALRYLENLELLSIRQGDGAYARSYLTSGNPAVAKAIINIDDRIKHSVLTSIMEVRKINSPEVAYQAALNRNEEHLIRLEHIANKWDAPMMERDKKLHHTIALAGGNIFHILLTNFFEDFFNEFGAPYFQNDENVKRSEMFHKDIYMAIKDQNAGEARKIMKDILSYAEKAVYKELGR